MPRKMQAAKAMRFGAPRLLRELDLPTPGAGQIVVKTGAGGVRHTDLHAACGNWPVKPALPFTPGHENLGNVSAQDAGVTAVKQADRVGVRWLFSACGHCGFCLAAQVPVRARKRNSTVTPKTAALPRSSSPTRPMSPTARPVWRHTVRRR